MGKKAKQKPEEVVRVRLPRHGEILGVVESMLGGNRLRVRCFDGKTRMGRIPGRIKKKVWIREGDVVIIIPWSFQDAKAEVVFRYTSPQVAWLKRKGIWQG
jgi:translation initiation factor 1A